MNPRPGLLFDLDGTLTDTDHLHFLTINRILARAGVELDLDAFRRNIVGRSNDSIFAEYFPHEPAHERRRLADLKESWARELMAEGLIRMAGLTELLAWAQDRQISCAVVTNAPRANADVMLAGLGLAARFPVVVIGDELPHGKPHPLPYRLGLERLGSDPACSVAFEDSRSGATAAVAAGIPTVGLTTSHTPAELADLGVSLSIADFTEPALMPFICRTLGL